MKKFWWNSKKTSSPTAGSVQDTNITDEAGEGLENSPQTTDAISVSSSVETTSEGAGDGAVPAAQDAQPTENIRNRWSSKKTVVLSIVGALVLLLIGAGVYVWSFWANPMGHFDHLADQMTPPPPTSQATKDPSDSSTPGPTATPDPYELLLAQADTGFLKDTVNIMLIGVDHSEERNTWSGKKAFHSDVMIVLAVNKATGAVNMISLPRDTYAKIPGVEGIYKLNASIDCGGGWPSESNGNSMSGFEKVCESASWMLGGIPVQYYYAVDMNAVKGLVDAIGGVQNFDVEMDFKMQGRFYKKGMQDMNGQAVLDYLRVRKGVSDAGDLNRINRQKKMLVAIFDKIKQNGLLASIPGLLDAFEGNLYTNTTLAQTAALAAFGYNVDSESIGMYSMGGRYNYGIFNWNFVLTDQDARVALIEKIYGVKVEKYADYSYSAAVAKWNRMQMPVVRKGAESVLSKVKARLDADAKLPVYGAATPTPAPTPTMPPVTTPAPTPPATTPTPTPPATTPTPGSTGEGGSVSSVNSLQTNRLALLGIPGSSGSAVTLSSTIPSGYRQYLPGGREWALYNTCSSQLSSLSSGNIESLKANIESLCRMFSIGIPSWRVNYESSNQVIVDFR